MQKRLSVVGNSLALVIDKPIRDLLGIRRETMLRISTDGRRLVVEPIGGAAHAANDVSSHVSIAASPPLGASEPGPVHVFRTLLNKYGISKVRFRELHHDPSSSLTRYLGWLQLGYARDANPLELATMRRLHQCLEALDAGAAWDDAITAALVAVPLAVD